MEHQALSQLLLYFKIIDYFLTLDCECDDDEHLVDASKQCRSDRPDDYCLCAEGYDETDDTCEGKKGK